MSASTGATASILRSKLQSSFANLCSCVSVTNFVSLRVWIAFIRNIGIRTSHIFLLFIRHAPGVWRPLLVRVTHPSQTTAFKLQTHVSTTQHFRSVFYLSFVTHEGEKSKQILCSRTHRPPLFVVYSLLRGGWGAGAPSTGAELGTESSWPACMRSLTRSWHPSCSMRIAILAMLRESSSPEWGRPSYLRPNFSNMVLSFVCVRGTWGRKRMVCALLVFRTFSNSTHI